MDPVARGRVALDEWLEAYRGHEEQAFQDLHRLAISGAEEAAGGMARELHATLEQYRDECARLDAERNKVIQRFADEWTTYQASLKRIADELDACANEIAAVRAADAAAGPEKDPEEVLQDWERSVVAQIKSFTDAGSASRGGKQAARGRKKS
ncbi:hypothetical protein H9P43_001528 [Blastocladiella emersonii ATCC 22665]|nr:hypothetical protein H9P43_001528 [Blastocladiella emersonii ATCC 22665]